MTKCGFVALIGEPNAGKSTLLNRMVGAKVSIVTHKVQTTRARIRGVAMEDETKLSLLIHRAFSNHAVGWTVPWWRRLGAGRQMLILLCCD